MKTKKNKRIPPSRLAESGIRFKLLLKNSGIAEDNRAVAKKPPASVA
jgi:hypothetical protein